MRKLLLTVSASIVACLGACATLPSPEPIPCHWLLYRPVPAAGFLLREDAKDEVKFTDVERMKKMTCLTDEDLVNFTKCEQR